MAAALELIADRGLSGVTMTSLADAAGVARQTLYNHFADLDAVVVSVLEQHGAAAIGQLRRLLEAAPRPTGQMDQVVRFSVAVADHRRDIGLLVGGLSQAAQQRIAEHSEAERQVIAEVIEAGIAEGHFRSDLGTGSMALVVQRMLETSGDLVAATGSAAAASSILGEMIRGSLAGDA